MNYTYSVLRYAHDVVTGERLNVGVLVVSESKIEFRIGGDLLRIKAAFPGVDVILLNSFLNHLVDAFAAFNTQVREAGDRSVLDFVGTDARSVVEAVAGGTGADTSYQWSEQGGGIGEHDDVIGRLILRMIPRFGDV